MRPDGRLAGGVLVAAILLLLFLRARETQGLRTCFALGLCGVLGILTRPTVLPFFVAACAYLGWMFHRRGGWRPVVAAVSYGLAGFLVAALPVMWLNYHVTRNVALLPSSGGLNLYIGNNPDMYRTLTVRPGYDWEQLCLLPMREEGITDDLPAKQQAFFYRKVRQYVLSQPLSFLAGLGAKTLRFLNSRELPRNVDIYMFRPWSPLLAALVWKVGNFGFPFGLLLPLALVGMVLRWRSVPAFLWIFLGLYPAAVILVFVAGRYRVPVVPAMAVVAAAGVFALVDLVRRRRWLVVGGLAMGMAATAVASSLPSSFCEERVNFVAELPFDLGIMQYENAEATGDKIAYEKAASYFQEAIRLRPDYVEPYLSLGNCRAIQGRLEDALASYTRATELNPKLTQALSNIGALNRKLKRWSEARDALIRALAVDDSFGLAHYHLAMVSLELGQPNQAEEHLVKAAKLDPDIVHRLAARFVLADVQAARGQVVQAVADYRQLLHDAGKAPPARQGQVAEGAGVVPGDLTRRVGPQRSRGREDGGISPSRSTKTAPMRRTSWRLPTPRSADSPTPWRPRRRPSHGLNAQGRPTWPWISSPAGSSTWKANRADEAGLTPSSLCRDAVTRPAGLATTGPGLSADDREVVGQIILHDLHPATHPFGDRLHLGRIVVEAVVVATGRAVVEQVEDHRVFGKFQQPSHRRGRNSAVVAQVQVECPGAEDHVEPPAFQAPAVEDVRAQEPSGRVPLAGGADHLFQEVHAGVVHVNPSGMAEGPQVAQAAAHVQQAPAGQLHVAQEHLKAVLLGGGVGPVQDIVAFPAGLDPRFVVGPDDRLFAHDASPSGGASR